MMPRQFKVNAGLVLVLAGVFYLFWQVCKQQPALAQVAPFTDDPYDAVGSIATQLALFAALLSVVRAFRPYQPGSAGDYQQALLVQGAGITCISIAVTLCVDLIALLRHPSIWVGLSAGAMLAALVGGMGLLTALVTWYTTHICKGAVLHRSWVRAIGISLVGVIIFVVYPERMTQSIFGEILTIMLSVIVFVVIVWSWVMALPSSPITGREDIIDDFRSLYQGLKAHLGRFSVVLVPVEKILAVPLLRPLLNWLNPRRHRWNGILLCGLGLGVALALIEAISEGGPGPTFILVAAIFVGAEALGVLLGYVLLATPLGLFRYDANGTETM